MEKISERTCGIMDGKGGETHDKNEKNLDRTPVDCRIGYRGYPGLAQAGTDLPGHQLFVAGAYGSRTADQGLCRRKRGVLWRMAPEPDRSAGSKPGDCGICTELSLPGRAAGGGTGLRPVPGRAASDAVGYPVGLYPVWLRCGGHYRLRPTVPCYGGLLRHRGRGYLCAG